MTMRIALTGASGTGKTTLAQHISEAHGLPINPVGSRSVSKAMGFDSPYDVDRAGKRAEFQRRLLIEKLEWESAHESFVADRTPLDNLAYTIMHDVNTIDAAMLDAAVHAMRRYDHVVYCPVRVFCNPGDDPARMTSTTYHKVYDAILRGLMDDAARMAQQFGRVLPLRTMHSSEVEERKKRIDSFF